MLVRFPSNTPWESTKSGFLFILTSRLPQAAMCDGVCVCVFHKLFVMKTIFKNLVIFDEDNIFVM
jgi:hypothetical protein